MVLGPGRSYMSCGGSMRDDEECAMWGETDPRAGTAYDRLGEATEYPLGGG